jgi:hypothetical protein
VTARADQRPYPPKTANPTPASFPESHGGASPESAAASARRRHDAPSATSDVPSATSNPKDGDGYAWGDAGGPSSLAPSEPPPATLGAILQLIVVKPATATTEPGKISAGKLRRPRSLGRKVSDEFTVPLWRDHHLDLQRYATRSRGGQSSDCTDGAGKESLTNDAAWCRRVGYSQDIAAASRRRNSGCVGNE